MKLFIKRVRCGSGVDAYALVDEHGETLPFQARTTLRSSPEEVPTFTVTFNAGEAGLQVLDEREES